MLQVSLIRLIPFCCPFISNCSDRNHTALWGCCRLIYCITVWGSIWTKNAQYNSSSITEEAMRKLQVCQNKCLRLITGHDYNTSTKTLLKDSKQLSVHQLVAYHSVCQVYSIYRSKLPTYHYNRLFKTDQILDGNIDGIYFQVIFKQQKQSKYLKRNAKSGL